MLADALLSDEQLKAIGLVAVECSYLDTVIELLIWHQCKLKLVRGRQITTNMMISARLDLLQGLLETKRLRPKAAALFSAIVSDIRIAIDERNTIIHGFWLPFQIEGRIGQTRKVIAKIPAAHRALKKADSDKSVRIDKVLATGAKLHECRQRLWGFAEKYLRWSIWDQD